MAIFGPNARSDGDHIVFFFDFRGSNPYQTLLYTNWPRAFAFDPGPPETALSQQAANQGLRRTVFHLHWENYCYAAATGEDEAAAAVEAFIAPLREFKRRGGPILWTVHNAEPHENRFPALDAAFRRELGQLADTVIVHSAEAARIVSDAGYASAARIHVMPHGNYRPIYAEVGNGARLTRNVLGNELRTFLFFGMVRQYKGVQPLLSTFIPFARTAPVNLILAGRGTEVVRQLDKRPLGGGGIARILGPAPDGDVPLIFAAADFVVFPFQKILTSGSLILALSLARPVIVPGFPTMRELIRDGVNGLIYDPADPDGLRTALERAVQLTDAQCAAMAAAARETALGLDWRQIGDGLADMLAGVDCRATGT